MTTKTNQSALALTVAIFTATLLASTSIPAYASERAGGSHSVGHGPNAPPHDGQKGGGTLISCHPGGCTETQVKGGGNGRKGGGTLVSCSPGTGCTETQVKGPTVYHNVPPPPTIYNSGTIPTSGQISGQVNGVLNGALGKGNPASGSTQTSAGLNGRVNGVLNGTLGIGNPSSGSTQTSGVPVKQVGGIGSGSNCALFGCSAPPAPTPPSGGGNPPKPGGGDHDHDHDHNYPGIVIEGTPGEIVDPAPVAAVPAPVVAARATVAAPQVVQAPCNCLTKQALADGSVLFQDICTKEAAIATPQSASVR